MEKTVAAPATPDWYDLLEQAVHEPGQLAAAHKFFHQYSLANRWLASTQLRHQGLPLTPINTFKGWLSAKRPVQKGQKASIALIMPVPIKAKRKDEEAEEDSKVVFTKFMLRNYWFHLGQTDGEEYIVEEKAEDWELAAALELLEVTEVPFEFTSVTDKRPGYALGKSFAVSPLETHPAFGRLRQLAHVVLGHTEVHPTKSVPLDVGVQDIEAETTAYLVAATLGFAGMEESRMKLQMHLAEKDRIPDRAAHRAFAAADKILNAGRC